MSLVENRSDWVPSWMRLLGTAAWLRRPDGTIGFLNRHAEHVFGGSAREYLDRPCHEVIRGRTPRGKPHCSKYCDVVKRAEDAREIVPFLIRTAGPSKPHWLQVLVIPITAPDGSFPWLVHCAIEVDRSQRIERYLSNIANRTPHDPNETPNLSTLTPREREVLSLLAGDLTLYAIAVHLDLSHSTVRNHVQHILAKLDVHSINEAIAFHLLN